MSMREELRKAIYEIGYEEIGDVVERALGSGMGPIDILGELREGLGTVGERYQSGEYFLSELYMASETMRRALDILTPLIEDEGLGEPAGTIVIGSMEGDIHDFGKTIVSSLLTAAGFRVIDLGIDVPAERFVDEAERVGADVIGISALLSTTQPLSSKVVEEIEARGLRGKYRVILGGTGVDPREAVERFGVDAAVNDGSEAVSILMSWVGGKVGPR